MALPETDKWGVFRRWLGIYDQQEREVLAYAKAIKREAILIGTGRKILPSQRPDWMRYDDFIRLRKLQKSLDRK